MNSITVFLLISSWDVSIDDGIVICANEEEHLKANLPTSVTEEGIVICVNDEQKLKAPSPILVTEEGIEICVNDEHPEKA